MPDHRTPRNTSADMRDLIDRLLFLGDALRDGSPGGAIEAMEKRGQQELVNSDVIPSDVGRDEEVLKELGFKLGDIVEGDPMFRHATLPAGWKREGSDHDMWSHVVDEHGRKRCSIFYKAAFYDRKAHLSVTTVAGYVWDCFHSEAAIIFDEEWATKDAVLAAIADMRRREAADVSLWTRHGNAEYVREHTENVARWDALRAEIESESP